MKCRTILVCVCCVLLLFNCASNEYRLIGITSRLQEVFYYGKDFSVSAWQVDEERLNKIRLELKNSLALQKLDSPKEKWKEVTELSTKDGHYVLFQIFPDSRVPSEFLTFQFQLNDTPPIKVFSYYSETIQTNIRSRYYYPGPFYIGGFYGDAGGFVYPLNSRPVENEVSRKLIHSYNFLILFPVGSIRKENFFRVITPIGNLIDFKLDSP